MTEISLQNNPIETIDDAAFDECLNTLQKLDFSFAKFTEIPKAIFRLNSLSSLSISRTDILVWNEEAMTRLGATMLTLDLDTVGLTTWPTWIQPFARLTELRVEGGSISFIPDNGLNMTSDTLTTLSLRNNSLTAVTKTIRKLTKLKTLLLQENRIADLTYLPQLSKLSVLSLHNNKISNDHNLISALHLYADTLFSLSLHDNELTAIPDLSFLTQISSLDYSNNHISDPNSGSIPPRTFQLILSNNFLPFIPRVLRSIHSVPKLELNANHITAIQGTDFLSSATDIDLGFNLIAELTDTSFPQNSSLVVLQLNNNPLFRISTEAFGNVPLLLELNLQYTHLTRVPVAIASLTSLNMLDVTGSKDLICTCLEKSLQPRILSMSSDFVRGDCGYTSIYNFFAHLSLSCP